LKKWLKLTKNSSKCRKKARKRPNCCHAASLVLREAGRRPDGQGWRRFRESRINQSNLE
jgi:hypothetical protein